MKTIDFSYFIERYNAGEMSGAEAEWFQKELKGNEHLRKETLLRKNTDQVLNSQNIISLRNKLSAIENKREVATSERRSAGRTYLKYVAILAGLIIIGSITLISKKTFSSEDIMNRYYKGYEPITAQRSSSSLNNSDLELAMEYYNAHDFKNAAILFNKVVVSNPKDMQSTLMKGIANFENKEYPAAKKSFGSVIDDNNNLFIDQAEWYLALCYLNTDELDKARQLLEAIKKEEGIYKNEAKKILRRIK